MKELNRIRRGTAGGFLLVGTLLAVACAPGGRGTTSLHIDLERIDGEMAYVGYSFEFEAERVAPRIEQYHPVLPEPLPSGAVVVYCQAGPFFGLVQKRAGESGIGLTLDANCNHDLTDDSALDLPLVESWAEGTVVRVSRSYETPEPHTVQLPYRISYMTREGRDGQDEDAITVCADYRFAGAFELGGREYTVGLDDGDVRGRFNRETAVNISVSIGLTEQMEIPGAAKHYRLFELAEIGGRLWEFNEIAEDGSWLEIVESDLPNIGLGQAVPDMEMTDIEGESFHLSDYRGQVLLLDFWPAWCGPCVAKFPAINEMVERYSDRPFAAIGINIDDERRLELARQIIADYDLTWRQVAEGKGEFISSYQVLGRLPERAMSFPIYVCIDEAGVARYATNDYQNVERFLAAHFSDDERERGVRFVSLTEHHHEQTPVDMAIDFSSERARALTDNPDLTLPGDLPAGYRLGRLPNGTVLLAWPYAAGESIHVVLDADRDFDLTDDEGADIPIIAGEVDDEEPVAITLIVAYAGGGRGFRPIRLYARSAESSAAGAEPAVRYRGDSQTFRGSFFVGRREYEIAVHDPTGDYLFTAEDWADSTILTLSRKRRGEWVPVYAGIDAVPIGGERYRVRWVSDDGALIELEPVR